MAKNENKEYLEKYLHYDPTSKTGLRWNFDFYVKRLRNCEAGFDDCSDGYFMLVLKGVKYRCHRLVLILNDKNLENKFCDHIDGDRKNNSLENLRVVDRTLNNRNRISFRSEVMGVTAMYIRGSEKYWRARWYDSDGVQKQKAFSVNQHGEKEAFDLACDARNKALLELNEKGMGYSNRHVSLSSLDEKENYNVAV